MKLIALCVSAALFFTSTVLANEKEYQTLIQGLTDQGHLVVDGGSVKPLEIHQEQIGRFIVCLSIDSDEVAVYLVRKTMFKNGAFSILVLCPEGKLFITNGYT